MKLQFNTFSITVIVDLVTEVYSEQHTRHNGTLSLHSKTHAWDKIR